MQARRELKESKCKCGELFSITTEFSQIIIIDVQLKNVSQILSLNEIPLQINMLNNTFDFVGCVEYINHNNSINNTGHYKSYIKRMNNT